MTIITHHVHPPIPTKAYDWAATLDGYDGAPDATGIYSFVGHGETEQEAIDSLKEQIEEAK